MRPRLRQGRLSGRQKDELLPCVERSGMLEKIRWLNPEPKLSGRRSNLADKPWLVRIKVRRMPKKIRRLEPPISGWRGRNGRRIELERLIGINRAGVPQKILWLNPEAER